jgi:hypothetical protein
MTKMNMMMGKGVMMNNNIGMDMSMPMSQMNMMMIPRATMKME